MIHGPVPGSTGLSAFLDLLNFLFQPWKITRSGIPDLVQIDTEVLVDEKMAHGNNVLPRNCRMFFLECRSDSVSRLSDHLDMVEHPDLEKVRCNELFF